MTTEIEELQNRVVGDILSLLYNGKQTIGVKAPTGSGKTHMMAMLMDKLLLESDRYIFIVSSLSKGDLAEQCYKSFMKNSEYSYMNLRPYLITTGKENEKNKEYSIQIQWGYNVYILPTNQYTTSSRINKEHSFLIFLENCKREGKEIILIRDESHIATTNLGKLNEYFSKTINFSATPKDNKFDVLLSEQEAVDAKLIKHIKYRDNANDELEEGLDKALREYKKDIRQKYLDYDITPAFIIQISNTQKGEQEFESIIRIVEKHGLQWVSFLADDKKYETNNALIKAKDKKLWRELIKQPNYPVEVIIFKMVITEGFDIPRACCLYQVRDTQSSQLDEQVIGRVRRNPYIQKFEKLPNDIQEHFSTAHIWGITKDRPNRVKEVQLRGAEILHQGNEIIKEFLPFKQVTLKEVVLSEVDISGCFPQKEDKRKNIFTAYRELQKCDEIIKKKRLEYVKDTKTYHQFTANLEAIKEKVKSVVEDYEKYGSMIEVKEGIRNSIYAFMDLNGNSYRCENGMWSTTQNTDNQDNPDEFHHDSISELEWFKILDNLKKDCCKVVTIDDDKFYLFGKNYIDNNSNIKFDYYDKKKHTSYPDFIFKDKNDTIHIFEVKSVNGGGNVDFDTDRYKEKIEKLKKAYMYASKKTGYVFYIPVKKDNDWQIWHCENGCIETEKNKATFSDYLRNRTKPSRT
ncbi:hypothetical protein BKH46_08645 [Helicobacter sp. 12S02634-8]|uniref:DEAD/DEAH box helicase n=1 Tax=Helicobacter sp. 12S02634-8 TaxID=1476199 RepID=UPI000BA775BA|nr:DEAD/DEAH box helicase family protein [Helicobacter sp. 12S02634-8]PAF46195.1 hypothetical protein BKH46_08645 [Helicobacter sp. 12S02634-8]